ncbi:MAG: DegV family protein, partial [Oscillospiraceae bacterium]|nr:DegV family protein [Oscillospiraceae bacterium]
IRNCLVSYVKDKLADPETVDPRRVFITDSGFDEETLALVEETVRACVPFREVLHTRAGCTISCHCGPGCLGILFYRR